MQSRRRESWQEQLYRYRGLATLVSIPVALILIILFVMPRSSPSQYTDSLPQDTFSQMGATEEERSVTVPVGKERYAVIFDAGSTGSRVHIYRFRQSPDGSKLELEKDIFEQIKPGLSSYAEDAEAAAKSLEPLLYQALENVPKELQAETPIKVGATAGLRLLPGGQSDAILLAVQTFLAASPFKLDPKTGVTVLDGTEEGAFAWLTLNYLLDKLAGDPSDTMAAIDLGGGSVQEAFALSEKEAGEAPNGYITKLRASGHTFHVYVHSYLGFGLMAGRAAVLSHEEVVNANPCIPTGHSGTYEYGKVSHQLQAHPDGATFEGCSKLVDLVLRQKEPCGAPQDQCAFNGAWGGSRQPKAFYVSSYFWDRAVEAGIIKDETALSYTLKPQDLSSAAESACTTPLTALAALFPSVDKTQGPLMCLDLTFCHTLLTKGFRIGEKSAVTLVKRIQYKDQQVEAAWPLGAAISVLS
ncbi:hypothetical protein WJX74_009079 [Apatococcus lobatus]|uniref:Apyrase n=1 Tax=Apatococcus lobatus TaxID=904363 RepID=A0AAW1SC80_9CHLO